MNDDTLADYLNNHLAGSVAGTELAERLLSESKGTPYESFVVRLLVEMEEDQGIVRRMIAAIGSRENTFKKIGAWAAEKFGLLKAVDFSGNPEYVRMLHLEGLLIGSRGRLGLWEAMEECRKDDLRFEFADFSFLRSRAEEHCRELDRLRLEAAGRAL